MTGGRAGSDPDVDLSGPPSASSPSCDVALSALSSVGPCSGKNPAPDCFYGCLPEPAEEAFFVFVISVMLKPSKLASESVDDPNISWYMGLACRLTKYRSQPKVI